MFPVRRCEWDPGVRESGVEEPKRRKGSTQTQDPQDKDEPLRRLDDSGLPWVVPVRSTGQLKGTETRDLSTWETE